MLNDLSIDVYDIIEWLVQYDDLLFQERGVRLHQHQSEALIELARRLRHHESLALPLELIVPTKAERDQQEKTRCVLEETRGFLLAADMGTGKSLVCLVGIELVHRFFPYLVTDTQGRNLPVLLVVPNTIRDIVWVREFEQWLINRNPHFDLFVIRSEKAEAERNLEAIKYLHPFAAVCSYDTLRVRLSTIKSISWGIVCADEVHYVKNPGSQRTKALYQIPCNLRFGLGGTPITNRPNDWWGSLAWLQGRNVTANIKGQPEFIRRSTVWGGLSKFVDTYCSTDTQGRPDGGKNLTPRGCKLCSKGCMNTCSYQFLGEANRKPYCAVCVKPLPEPCQSCARPLHPRALRDVMHRKRFADCIDLPPIQVIDRFHELTETQQMLYEKIKNGLLAWTEEAGRWQGFKISNILSQFLYFLECCVDLRQLQQALLNQKKDTTLGYANLKANILAGIPESEISGKRNSLFELLREEIDLSQEKAIIFSAFAVTARALCADLKAYHPVLVDGESNQKGQTVERVTRFRDDPQCRLFIGTSAAFEGLTLTAARWVILYGFVNWSPMRIWQAVKRAHRQGQDGVVRVVKLLARGTIEEKVLAKLVGKMADFDAAVDGGVTDNTSIFRLDDNIMALV